MKIEIITHMVGHGFTLRRGDIVERPDREAARLIAAGYAREPIEPIDQPEQAEQADHADRPGQQTERAIAPPIERRTRPRRPRKQVQR